MAITGFGLHGGDDPAFDYVVQAGFGIAALTGDPDGPPTLPGYSSADNSTGMCAALGLLAKIISGTGGQVDVSLRDVMLSQLNYHASAYLNDGVEPQRRPNGAHSYYVPAQLFPTADGYLALFITHDGFWKSFATEAGIGGFETMAERVARRDEVLAVVTAMLATDTAAGLGTATASAGGARGGGQNAARGAQSDPGSGCDCGRFPPRRESDPCLRVSARIPAAAGASRIGATSSSVRLAAHSMPSVKLAAHSRWITALRQLASAGRAAPIRRAAGWTRPRQRLWRAGLSRSPARGAFARTGSS